ncbi:TonB-dependent receptor domain-containing protein [Aliarcobacter thereius]|uniref:TonB-dependent receptor domain-containing protein n=1 Tax=Aliarcobacter thereius TaxID=544718 RepID=UPI00224AB40A|nr:TonB-dependent receptor [Aliarcobacter thereius]
MHYELSYQRYYNGLNFALAGFFTRVDDAIQNVTYNSNKNLKQNQNIGSFDHRGIELDLEYANDDFKIGTNYTFISIKNRSNNNDKIVDVPKHQIFFFAQKEIGAGFSIYGNMKFRKGAYENKMDKSYVKNPTTTIFDIKAIYKANKNLSAQIGVKNIGDKLIRYDMAYPMAGREYFASLEYKF